ncbi:Uu.00g085960.m01.CDS01 [Anthostomella pinea]|uniref:Uu.00g085960.m01.CDS01 n=1 Tax=Anthostomella pinea TaxID=933095 RepID=A0AAI8YJU7_9PEZI|nr:Uu.00g085960.m01.CDS01 [Anthostomella pinea]
MHATSAVSNTMETHFQPQPLQPTGQISISPRWALAALLFSGAALATFRLAGSAADDDDDIINKASFSAFTITSKEQVSPTAFILSIRVSKAAGGPVDSQRIGQAWAHGLWSVEIKQPQLQIARHYTPLPPPPPPPFTKSVGGDPNGGKAQAEAGSGSGCRDDELRFLIRKMDGGEMSNYLSKLRVGDQVWLRGPHLGFDVGRRLGEARDVVFLAGGTGIAPALQAAHRLLDSRPSTGVAVGDEKPTVSIMWANRRAVDALGREQRQIPVRKGWFGLGGGAKTETPQRDEGNQSSFARQILSMKKQHGKHFDISYFVDEEKSFISAKDLVAILSRPQTTASSGLASPAKSCPWHSATSVARLPNDNDAERVSDCSCKRTAPGDRLGAELFCVSGPDGFIEAYAGPKRWQEGNEMQGAVQGLLGSMKKSRPGEMDDWLVLKL